MDEYTFKTPKNTQFLQGVITILRQNKDEYIADLLDGSTCEIVTSNSLSHRRLGSHHAFVRFNVHLLNLRNFTENEKRKLIEVCNFVMPQTAGYDIINVEISPILEDSSIEGNLLTDLKEISSLLSHDINSPLPKDIEKRGKEMAEVYLYLYCIENSVRLFIENIAKEKFGNDYFSKLNITRSLQKGIDIRKKEEASQKWMRIRGDSEIFYLDFADLGTLIQSNWDLFKDHFPDLQWIMSKLDEIVKCRNLVAHNSYIGDHEKDVIRVNYKSILKQIDAIK